MLIHVKKNTMTQWFMQMNSCEEFYLEMYVGPGQKLWVSGFESLQVLDQLAAIVRVLESEGFSFTFKSRDTPQL